MNKIIVIEGTDCSGKETQSNLLMERLKKDGIPIEKFGFPNYDSPTGKIVGGAYLGKKHICECIFPEGAVNVDPMVANLYYAADRRYNLPIINEKLSKGNLILDRYVESNMAHQGGKEKDEHKRYKIYQTIEMLEYNLLELPRPDKTIFLYMPYEYSLKLRQGRTEDADQHELDKDHLMNAEKTYLELAKRYDFYTINCVVDGRIKSIEEINEEVYKYVSDILKK